MFKKNCFSKDVWLYALYVYYENNLLKLIFNLNKINYVELYVI